MGCIRWRGLRLVIPTDRKIPLYTQPGFHLRIPSSLCPLLTWLCQAAPSSIAQQEPKTWEREEKRVALQEAGTSPKQYVPNFLLRGRQRHVPSRPPRLSPAVNAPSLSPCVCCQIFPI